MPQTEPKWLTLARAEIGVQEIKGPQSNEKILEYFKDAGHDEIDNEDVAWCAAFTSAILKRAGVAPLQPSKSLGARNYERWGIPLTSPRLGAIGVKYRAGGSPKDWTGHVGIIVAANPTTIWMISGNSRNRVGIDAFRRVEFTAYRWPNDIPITFLPLPTTADGALGASEA